MNEEAGEYAGLTVAEAQRPRRRRPARRSARCAARSPTRTPSRSRTAPASASSRSSRSSGSCAWTSSPGPRSTPSPSGRVRIHPESQSRRYVDWLENIRPVVHQPPALVGPPAARLVPRRTRRHVGMEPPEGDGWTREEDVLDTWFSSALWPFATLGWPDETPDLRAFYPTDVLSTARDILFLWVARMVMMGLRFAGDIPFDHVYVHSVIQAPDGRRMSKSLGTGIDPLEEIDRHGADAVRFGLLAMSSTQDVRYSTEKVEQGQALATKLFNASRFVLHERRARHRRRAAADDARGPLDPLAPAARHRRHVAAHRRVRVRQGRARALRLRLRRALRLVPRARQGPRRWTPTCRRRSCTCCARRSRSPTRSSRSSPRRSGTPCRTPTGCSPGAPFPQADPALDRRRRRGADRRRHRGGPRRARVAQRGGRPGRRASCRRVCGPTGFEETAPLVARLARLDLDAGEADGAQRGRDGRSCPAAASSCCPRPASTPPSRSASSPRGAPSSRGRSSAPRASSPTRASSPRPRRSSWRPSARSSSGSSPSSPSL